MRNAYDIEVQSISKIKVPSHNNIFKVDAGATSYVVKIFSNINFTPVRPGGKSDHIQYEAEILDRLEQCGVPVIGILHDKNDHAINTVDSRKAMVFRYVEGGYFNNSDKQITCSAGILAKAHQCLPEQALSTSDFDYQTYVTFWLGRLAALRDTERFIECIPDRSGFLEIGRKVEDWIGHADTRRNIAWVHGHGDVHPRNYIYRDESALLFDFQAARLMPRLADIADGLVEFGIFNDSVEAERMKSFLAGYETEYPLTGTEKERLNEFLLADCFIKAVSMLQSDIYFGYKVNKSRMKAFLDLASSLSD